ncbi:hypothetical protein Pmani_034675 [Petrolisthes manimaculis]|uniref:Uncharacterized protein n=1 Tax=Petrolisthes manimaculis TaxID=1843537 RepID=A0AAE1NNV7_9EUCA|nr:hypothetical protein Pmani_034675 [Petrolisthes manimaculis]
MTTPGAYDGRKRKKMLRLTTGVWAVVSLVVCLAAHHAHAQLGESTGVGGGGGREVEEGRMEVEMEVEVVNYDNEDEETDEETEEEEEEGGDEGRGRSGAETEPTTPFRWKAVDETYQGCIFDDTFFNLTDTVLFVNLTQVMEVDSLDSIEEACYHMCLIKEPFSYYLTLSPSTRPNDTDVCSCHQENQLLQENMLEDDTNCDKYKELHRVYCGPANHKCYSRASGGVGSSWCLFISTLTLLITRSLLH